MTETPMPPNAVRYWESERDRTAAILARYPGLSQPTVEAWHDHAVALLEEAQRAPAVAERLVACRCVVPTGGRHADDCPNAEPEPLPAFAVLALEHRDADRRRLDRLHDEVDSLEPEPMPSTAVLDRAFLVAVNLEHVDPRPDPSAADLAAAHHLAHLENCQRASDLLAAAEDVVRTARAAYVDAMRAALAP